MYKHIAWDVFAETGEPVGYLIYKRTEDAEYVPELHRRSTETAKASGIRREHEGA